MDWARVLLLLAAGVAADSGALADDLLPPDREIAEVVDTYLSAKRTREGVKAAPETDDAGLLRRLTLDLVGRIPSAEETRRYLESTEPGKRGALVDRLMAAPGFVRHQVDEFDAMMMAGTRASLRDYLATAIGENRPWDRIFREVVTADESEPGRKGSGAFLKPRIRDLDRLTNDVSTTFFGVNVSCAKCHDHPRVHDWKQDHFYGMKAFFGRTFENGEYLGERSSGGIKFQTTKGQERRASPMFLTGQVVEIPGPEEASKDEQKLERRRFEEAKKKKVPPPPPAFSARAKLVEVALAPGEREFFARAIVNRVWHRFFGLGLVMPLDQMHSENPPSHPELLSWLARDLVEHGYDLRRLTRGLVLSRSYARSSRWDQGEAPDSRLFAVATIRPLTPVQLALSMWVATTDPAALVGDGADTRVEAFRDRARNLAEAFARPGEDYQIGVSEALLLSNSEKTKELLGTGSDRLITRLLSIQDRDKRIAVAVRNVLSRAPAEDEVSLLGDYLARRDERPEEACRQLVWALLAGAEFRFNH